MDRTAVSSSSIASVGHEGDTLEVEFTSGKIYRYAGVSASDAAALMGARSIGRHFGENVRGKFDHSLVATDEASAGQRQ